MFERLIPSMKVIFNSRTIDANQVALQIDNRAFCYGDGLFETIVTGPNRINLINYHVDRLKRACKVLALDFPSTLSAKYLQESIDMLAKANDLTGNVRTKLTLFRETGGLYSPEHANASFLIACKSATKPFYRKGGDLVLSKSAYTTYTAISFAKTVSAMPYVLAGIEMKQKQANEIVLTNEQGDIAETHLANIFWIKGGELFTPSINTGCIEGVFRSYLLDLLKESKTSIQIGEFDKSHLEAADCIFSTNASGISYFQSFEGIKKEAPLPLLKKLIPQLPL